MDLLKLHIELFNEGGKIEKDLKYFSAFEEEGKIIAQADDDHIKNDKIEGHLIPARKEGELALVEVK